MNKLPPMLLTATMLLGLPAGSLMAQYQLDNNLEQSSGQYNPQATNVDYGSRNDIIYGNINEGKGFRGNLNYGAPGDFRGNTGSDALFRFRANTAPSATGQQLTQPQSVQRASHSAVLGNIQSYNARQNSAMPSSGLPVDAYRTGQATTYGQMIQTPEFGASRAGTMGIQGDLSGRGLGVGATSAQGIGTPSDTPIGPVNLSPVGMGDSAPQTTTGSYIDSLANPLPDTAGITGHGIAGTSDSLWKTDPAANLAYPQSTAMTPEQIIAPAQSAPGNLLSPQPANAPALSMEQKAAQLQAQQQQLEASLSSNVGEDTYMKLQNMQENRQRVAQGLQPLQHGVQTDNQLVADPSQIRALPSQQTLFNSLTGADMDADTDTYSNSAASGYNPNATVQPYPGLNAPMSQSPARTTLLNPNAMTQTMPQPTAQEQAQARQQLQDAMLQSRGVTDSTVILDQVVGIQTPSTAPVEPVVESRPTGGLFAPTPGGASRSLPARGSIANTPGFGQPMSETDANTMMLGGVSTTTDTGITVQATQMPQTTASMQREWHSNQSLSQATLALKAGRYIDAERQFKSVLLGNPQSYEASAGLICAQLGAGMVRATILNLRKHMIKFPQQIAYKLDRNFLPSGQRLTWVREQSENLMQQYGNFDAALLLAFMGYQTSDKQLLQYGLELAQKHLPGDQLVIDLSRAWLGQ